MFVFNLRTFFYSFYFLAPLCLFGKTNKQQKKNLQSTCKRGMGMEGNVRNVPETPQWEKGRRKRRFSRCWSRDVPALACGGDHSEVESSCSPWRTAPEQVPLLHPSGRPYATVGGLKRKLEPLERPHRCRFSGRNCGPWGTPAGAVFSEGLPCGQDLLFELQPVERTHAGAV